MITTGDLWITHYSVGSWMSAQDWDDYLGAVETVLSDRLVKLDDTDPVRRKADTTRGEGSFVVEFGEHETSRWVRGKFEKTKVEIEVQHYKSGKDSFGRERENLLTIYIPERMTFGSDVRKVIELFRLGNERLRAFYAYADIKGVICAKKPSTPSLDISRELLGVFWLTYFGQHYCNYFGRDRLVSIKTASIGPDCGITFRLAEVPGDLIGDERVALERTISAESFAGTGGQKARGQHALTLMQLAQPPLVGE